jgi:hypothetical protein
MHRRQARLVYLFNGLFFDRDFPLSNSWDRIEEAAKTLGAACRSTRAAARAGIAARKRNPPIESGEGV